jgi:hypothetical protein
MGWLISRSNYSLNGLKHVRKYFSTKELVNLVTSNYFSILLYNSEIWQTPFLRETPKHLIFVASSKTLKMCNHYNDRLISYTNLHTYKTK